MIHYTEIMFMLVYKIIKLINIKPYDTLYCLEIQYRYDKIKKLNIYTHGCCTHDLQLMLPIRNICRH